MSKLEDKIARILNNENIPYTKEKVFSDCYNGKYRYDFYLPNHNICIECNGEQHYEFTKIFFKNRSEFLKAQERDRRKISYCLANEISLYIIPYWKIDSIKNFDDIMSEEFKPKSKFHNDETLRNKN